MHWVGGGGVLQKPLLHTWPSSHGTSGQVVTSLLWHSMSVSVAQNWFSAQSPSLVQPIAQMPFQQNWPSGHGLDALHGPGTSPSVVVGLPLGLPVGLVEAVEAPSVSSELSVPSPSEALQAARHRAAKSERSFKVVVVVMASFSRSIGSLPRRRFFSGPGP
ncbi:hypothetical protein OV079_48105 [Nannocystis pusilla]|uniref:Uncharacterized protein n=1 Tax=Nannocystis pusilla TaxID=889268 RepID=A0A9X3J3T4_9BACT|nr:hypothetical protein [Nannocystis pusilla]MCY1013169.1 hypothetical protein [Nannocystis pusilla]